jgi:hypothetical protein
VARLTHEVTVLTPGYSMRVWRLDESSDVALHVSAGTFTALASPAAQGFGLYVDDECLFSDTSVSGCGCKVICSMRSA